MDPRALAEQVGNAIKETPEYLAVKTARAKVDGHEAARIMLDDFDKRQTSYRQHALEGKADEAELDELRKLAEIVGYNPYIKEFMMAETRLADLLMDIQSRMMRAAGLVEPEKAKEHEADAESV